MKAALKNEGIEEGTRRREECISPGVLISNAIKALHNVCSPLIMLHVTAGFIRPLF